jgi:hypothetical protein
MNSSSNSLSNFTDKLFIPQSLFMLYFINDKM